MCKDLSLYHFSSLKTFKIFFLQKIIKIGKKKNINKDLHTKLSNCIQSQFLVLDYINSEMPDVLCKE